MLRVAVVGAGSWGTTVASLVAGHADTRLWAREVEVVEAVNQRHENTLFLPDIALSPALRATGALEEALDHADVVVMGVPAQHFRGVFTQAADLLPSDTPVVSLVKGIERDTLQRMTEIVRDLNDHDPRRVGVLTGPNLAREVAVGQPSATVVALVDDEWSRRLQHLFMSPTFRVYTNQDVVGCELAGAVKNVIAIAAGIVHGLGFGENTKAALLTRGLAELARLGTALGGQPLTFLGLAGNGDLVATCSSPQSRNRTVGTELGRGRAIEDIVADMHMVAEGVETTSSVLALAERVNVEMPIARQVAAVIHEHLPPLDALAALMEREPKPELDDLRTGAQP
jgi:glycerol-3-phosphate dehydrogenase (NAD(P)+)